MPTKVKLSTQELSVVTNANIILTKNHILEQVVEFFGHLSQQYQTIQPIIQMPKISKGENYNGLPWVMLDYNSVFTKNNVFAYRTFFWWGHFISLSLQVKGKFTQNTMPAIAALQQNNTSNNWVITVNENQEWNHSLQQCTLLKQYTTTENSLPFFKVAIKIPLEKWDDIESFCTENFLLLHTLFKHPNGETIL